MAPHPIATAEPRWEEAGVLVQLDKLFALVRSVSNRVPHGLGPRGHSLARVASAGGLVPCGQAVATWPGTPSPSQRRGRHDVGGLRRSVSQGCSINVAQSGCAFDFCYNHRHERYTQALGADCPPPDLGGPGSAMFLLCARLGNMDRSAHASRPC